MNGALSGLPAATQSATALTTGGDGGNSGNGGNGGNDGNSSGRGHGRNSSSRGNDNNSSISGNGSNSRGSDNGSGSGIGDSGDSGRGGGSNGGGIPQPPGAPFQGNTVAPNDSGEIARFLPTKNSPSGYHLQSQPSSLMPKLETFTSRTETPLSEAQKLIARLDQLDDSTGLSDDSVSKLNLDKQLDDMKYRSTKSCCFASSTPITDTMTGLASIKLDGLNLYS